MQGNQLSSAFGEILAASDQPPAMDSSTMLTVARGARRRRYLWRCGCGAAALAIAALAAGTAIAGADRVDGSRLRAGIAATGDGGQRLSDIPAPSSGAGSSGTAAVPSRSGASPRGQYTADSGVDYDKAVKLLDVLVAAVPEGYTIPTRAVGEPDPTDTGEAYQRFRPSIRSSNGTASAPGGASGRPRTSHQAVRNSSKDGSEYWEYTANVVLTRDGGYGWLQAQVVPRVPAMGLCDVVANFGASTGSCELLQIGQRSVALVSAKSTPGPRFDQLAVYQYPDGVMVLVSQGRNLAAGSQKGLDSEPLSGPRLAEYALLEGLHFD